MELLKELLDNYIIVKDQNRELYYDIKDNLSSFKFFIQDKLGYDVILHQDFIKLEKFPGKVESWMGIKEFEDKLDYCFLILFLMFLEDKGKEEQFVLSQLVEYMTSNFEEESIDWTVYSIRKSLVRVLRFAQALVLIRLNDGDENIFANNNSGEVLYENTGISKYMVRTFPIDIFEANSYRDFIDFAWEDMDRDRGTLRKNRVYRSLILSPILYNDGEDNQDYAYIRNYKNILENDFEKYLGWKLHIHKDGALVVLDQGDRCKEYFPSIGVISDIALCFNKKILSKIKLGELNLSLNSNIEMTEREFMELLKALRLEKSDGWSKEYRECTDHYLYNNLTEFMKGYNMLNIKKGNHIIKALTGKIIGDYPKSYVEKENSGD